MKTQRENYLNYNVKLSQIKQIIEQKKVELSGTNDDGLRAEISGQIQTLTAEADKLVNEAIAKGINLNVD